MCGIAGLWRFDGGSEAELAATARAMTAAIAHRGPDGDGHWVDAGAGVALGHRRLAIIDLSPTGYQPMLSADGRFVITYNGELYNRAEMAAELGVQLARHLRHRSPGRGDRAFRHRRRARARQRLVCLRGLRRAQRTSCISRATGSASSRSTARGKRACLRLPPSCAACMQSPDSHLRSISGRSPRTFATAACRRRVASIATSQKLLPGCRLEVTRAGLTSRTYWDHAAIAQANQQALDRRPDGDIDEELHELLFDAVKRQMVSDVPLGAFLSGGIDSSTVVALMQRASTRPVRTFSIGFDEAGVQRGGRCPARCRSTWEPIIPS